MWLQAEELTYLFLLHNSYSGQANIYHKAYLEKMFQIKLVKHLNDKHADLTEQQRLLFVMNNKDIIQIPTVSHIKSIFFFNWAIQSKFNVNLALDGDEAWMKSDLQMTTKVDLKQIT